MGVRGVSAADSGWLSTHGGYVARYCAWVAATTGVNGADRLTPVALLGDGLIDAYMAGGLEGGPRR